MESNLLGGAGKTRSNAAAFGQCIGSRFANAQADGPKTYWAAMQSTAPTQTLKARHGIQASRPTDPKSTGPIRSTAQTNNPKSTTLEPMEQADGPQTHWADPVACADPAKLDPMQRPSAAALDLVLQP